MGYAAHFGGALAGLFVGLFILRNLRARKWEVILRKVGLALSIILLLFAIAWNIFYTDYFPASRYD